MKKASFAGGSAEPTDDEIVQYLLCNYVCDEEADSENEESDNEEEEGAAFATLEEVDEGVHL